MSTRAKPEKRDGNVGVRIDRKRGRDLCLFREFEDAGGVREFTLYLSVDEASRLADLLDDALDRLEQIEAHG